MATKWFCMHCQKLIWHKTYKRNDDCPHCGSTFYSVVSVINQRIIIPKEKRHGDFIDTYPES